jgi:hypothetical protein
MHMSGFMFGKHHTFAFPLCIFLWKRETYYVHLKFAKNITNFGLLGCTYVLFVLPYSLGMPKSRYLPNIGLDLV